MEYSEEKLEELADTIVEFIKSVPEEEKTFVAHMLMDDIVFTSTCNHLEAMGSIELFKINFHKTFEAICDENREEAVK